MTFYADVICAVIVFHFRVGTFHSGADMIAILRLVETRGRHSTGILHFSKNPGEVTETDLLEWHDGEPLLLQENALEVKLDPFEIMTLRVK